MSLAPGDKVRIREGVRDPDGILDTLSGMSGTIDEIHKNGNVCVLFDTETRAKLTLEYVAKCDKRHLDPFCVTVEPGNVEKI